MWSRTGNTLMSLQSISRRAVRRPCAQAAMPSRPRSRARCIIVATGRRETPDRHYGRNKHHARDNGTPIMAERLLQAQMQAPTQMLLPCMMIMRACVLTDGHSLTTAGCSNRAHRRQTHALQPRAPRWHTSRVPPRHILLPRPPAAAIRREGKDDWQTTTGLACAQRGAPARTASA